MENESHAVFIIAALDSFIMWAAMKTADSF
jgi:hypothetical protein